MPCGDLASFQRRLRSLHLPAFITTAILATTTHFASTSTSMTIMPAATTMNKNHLLSVGLSTVDFVATVDHFPEPDEKMRSSQLIIEGGGNAANTACAMGRLSQLFSTNVSLVTGVGDDANGNTILDSVKSNDVNVMAERYPGSSPFSYILSADIEGDTTRTCIHQPASGEMSIAFVEELSLDEVTAVHFDCRYPTAAVALAKRCVNMGIPYSVDVERPREGLLELLQHASVVICNSLYCDTILGRPLDDDDTSTSTEGPGDRLRTVMQQQAPKAIIAVTTLGSKGSCLIRMDKDKLDGVDDSDGVVSLSDDEKNTPLVTLEKNVLSCSVFQNVNVVDTTGAGDAFIGAFLTAIWWASMHRKNQQSKHGGTSTSSETGKDDDSMIEAPETDATRIATKKVEKRGVRTRDLLRIQPPTDVNVLARALRIASRVAAQKVEQPGARSGLPFSDDEFISMEMKLLQYELSTVAE